MRDKGSWIGYVESVELVILNLQAIQGDCYVISADNLNYI